MATTRKTPRKSKSHQAKPKSQSSKRATKARSVKKTRAGAATEPSAKAVRMMFAYDGDEVKLVSQQRVDMIVPPTDPVKTATREKGFWAELKSAKNKTLYRRVMHNPTRNDAEVFSDDPNQTISRAPAPKRKGVFVVVVPDTDEADAVSLVRSSPGDQKLDRGLRSLAAEPAKEFARFKLKK